MFWVLVAQGEPHFGAKSSALLRFGLLPARLSDGGRGEPRHGAFFLEAPAFGHAPEGG